MMSALRWAAMRANLLFGGLARHTEESALRVGSESPKQFTPHLVYLTSLGQPKHQPAQTQQRMASEIHKESIPHLGRETNSSSPPRRPVPPPPAVTSGVIPPPAAANQVTMPVPDSTVYWRTQVLDMTAMPPPGTMAWEQGMSPYRKKSILEAYMLGLPLGALGLHHAYLGRPAFCIMYIFTFGLLGFGWFVDLLRMPCLVNRVNKQNREKYEEFIRLQQYFRQQQLLQQQKKTVMVAVGGKSLDDAYIMWFPFGLLGFHHFYLRNYGMGLLYLFTFGLFGLGWLADLFLMPYLVKKSNRRTLEFKDVEKSQCLAQMLAMSPAGIFGCHHYYLGRPLWGLLYTFTGGLFFSGWVADWFRSCILAKRANAILRGLVPQHTKYVDDAYILCFPWGFLGLHHFYLRRYGWGFLYFFTLGLFGVGWIIDWFRLPCLVNEANAVISGQGQGVIIATASSPLVGNAVIVGGVTGAPAGVVNYGYQGQVITPPSAPYSHPSPGYGGYEYQAGYLGKTHVRTHPSTPPPAYTASEDTASGATAGPAIPYHHVSEEKSANSW